MKSVELYPGIWNLAPGEVNCYLVTGTEKALVIDTGFGRDDVRALAQAITSLPLMLVNTHYHRDHTGRNSDFDALYAHPLEFDRLRASNPKLIPADDGYVFDLGGRKLSVLHCPGHTPGSICLLDEGDKVIFTGDIIADVPIFMQNDDSDLEAYINSLDRISSLKEKYDTILCCHGTCPIPFEYISRLRKCAVSVISGELEGEIITLEFPDKKDSVRVCRQDGVGFLRKV